MAQTKEIDYDTAMFLHAAWKVGAAERKVFLSEIYPAMETVDANGEPVFNPIRDAELGLHFELCDHGVHIALMVEDEPLWMN